MTINQIKPGSLKYFDKFDRETSRFSFEVEVKFESFCPRLIAIYGM